MRMRASSVLFVVAVLAGACTTIEGENRKSTLIPAKTLNLSPSIMIPAEWIAAAGAAFFVIDPLAPNWKVEVETLSAQRYRIAMTMKRFTNGGEGESDAILRRTAEKLVRERGSAGYAVLEQTEGIDSHVTLPQRVAHAVIELR
jgi:hypothetical protein